MRCETRSDKLTIGREKNALFLKADTNLQTKKIALYKIKVLELSHKKAHLIEPIHIVAEMLQSDKCASTEAQFVSYWNLAQITRRFSHLAELCRPARVAVCVWPQTVPKQMQHESDEAQL